MMEEFEPITADNICEVLKYNGFENTIDTEFEKNDCLFITKQKEYYFEMSNEIIYESITSASLNRVLNFMKEFIELKPLPKKPLFDARKLLLDNGFSIDESDIIKYKGFYFGMFSLDDKELYFGMNAYALTKENLQKVVDAAKILEGLEA